MQQTVSGREVVDALESRGVKFVLDEKTHGFDVEAPTDFDHPHLLALMNKHSEAVGKYLLARAEHIDRLMVVNTNRTKH